MARTDPPARMTSTSRLRLVAALVWCGALASAAGAQKPPETFTELRASLPEEATARQRALEAFAREPRAALSDRLLALSALGRTIDDRPAALAEVYLYEAHLRAVGNAAGLRKKALARAAKVLRRRLSTLEDELNKASKADAPRSKRGKAKKSKKRSRRSKKRAAKPRGGKPGDKADPAAAVPAEELAQQRQRLAERLEHVEAVMNADQALTRLRRAIRDRAKTQSRRPADGGEAAAVGRLTELLPHYDALDDRRQSGEAQLALILFLEYSDADRKDVDRALSRLVRLGGRDRDLARVREKVRRARARILAELGDWKEAVHESLVADRAGGVPSQQSAFHKPEPEPYARSRTTAELCWAALARGVQCSAVEEERSGELTFYDYSGERQRAFNPERAQMALAEFQPLLHQCLKAAVASGDQVNNTTVQLEWSIGLDGKVSIFSILPRRLRGTPVEACMKAAFERFRYPQYRGEMQHTQLSFDIGG